MSAQPSSIATTIRGKAALDEVRSLLDDLAKIDQDLAHCHGYIRQGVENGPVVLVDMSWPTITGIFISYDELVSVIIRRREVIINTLQNKGIRIAPDPEPVSAPPMTHGQLEAAPANVSASFGVIS